MSTRASFNVSPNKFDTGTAHSVKEGVEDIVKNFKLMYISTKATIENLIKLVPELISITEEGISTIEEKATFSKKKNDIVQGSFESVNNSNFADVEMSASTVNELNDASLAAVQGGIKAFKDSEELSFEMKLLSTSGEEERK